MTNIDNINKYGTLMLKDIQKLKRYFFKIKLLNVIDVFNGKFGIKKAKNKQNEKAKRILWKLKRNTQIFDYTLDELENNDSTYVFGGKYFLKYIPSFIHNQQIIPNYKKIVEFEKDIIQEISYYS